jgi:hypothetical protein
MRAEGSRGSYAPSPCANEGSNANHSQNTPDEWRPRRCGLFAQRGRAPRVQRSGRKFYIHPGWYARSPADTAHHQPPRRRGVPHGRSLRQGHAHARCVRSHSWTRSHPRQHRHSLCPPRLYPSGVAGGAGGARGPRQGSRTGDRLHSLFRQPGQMGDRGE